jgi:dolichyl-diphosphooligosaccharide--protein glycosyltransferase
VSIFLVSLAALVALTVSGTIAPWTGRFYSLWDTGYAKIHIPIIASVSEHQPTPWPSYFFDLSWLIWLFPGGVYLCFKKLGDEHVFVIVYAVMVLSLEKKKLISGELLFRCYGAVNVDFDSGCLCLWWDCCE